MAQSDVVYQHYPHTYHQTEAAYLLPNSYVFDRIPTRRYPPHYVDSTPEQRRLASQAAALKALVGGNVLHTVNLADSPTTRFLDVGCGTGTVAYDIGRQYPSSRVFGVDLSPIQILDNKPPNVEIIRGDLFELAGQDERLQPGSFDFVFSRLLICGMTDWIKYLKTVAYLLKPGAPCEFQEFTWQHHRNGEVISSGWKWMQAAYDGARKQGLDLDCGKHMADYARQAGLRDIKTKFYAVPAGIWAADSNPQSEAIGKEYQETEVGFHLVAQRKMVDQTQYSEEERRMLAEDCERTLEAEREGRYWPLIVTLARRSD